MNEKIQAQINYCRKHGVPLFAPRKGVCWSCGRQIYDKISLKRAASELITSCPYCNRSYCE